MTICIDNSDSDSDIESYDDNNDDEKDVNLRLSVSCNVCLAVWTHSGHRVRLK